MIAADALRAADHAREIREKKWTKYYIARVEARTSAGAATEIVGRHRAYVRREGRLARCVRSGGDPASLEVLAVALAEDAPRHAHLLIRLETGRFHQIRVMMANLGFPLVGDLDYHGRPWRAGVEAESPTQHSSAARTQASQPSQVAPRALTGALTGDLKRNLKRDSRGLELLAAGLRIDRAEGPTIIEALPDVVQQLGVAQTMVQKLRGALSVAAR
jgi:23S rRNA-/tRNA-specific pseudouridylate synthase